MAEALIKGGLFWSSGNRVSVCGSSRATAGRSSSSVFCAAPLSRKVETLRRSSSGYIRRGRVVLRPEGRGKTMKGALQSVPVQMSLGTRKTIKWWEKGLQPNMKEVQSAQDLVDSLLNAGNKLFIVDFFSPGCGGCKALHPKICQFAEMNPDVQFLQINYEEHKSMCYSLNVHVLPFFRFYRGAEGRLCSFSCTNATIKKFKDALAKHGTERCSLGPARGLEEPELMALSANRDLSFTYTARPKPVAAPLEVAEPALAFPKLPPFSPPETAQESEEEAVVQAGR